MSHPTIKSAICNKYSATGRHTGFKVYLHHKGLDLRRDLSAADKTSLQNKIHNQCAIWDKKWEKEQVRRKAQSKEEEAQNRTTEAQNKLKNLEATLEYTLNINDAIDWETLKYNDIFSAKPKKNSSLAFNKKTGYPEKIQEITLMPLPTIDDFRAPIPLIYKLLRQSEKIKEKQEKEYLTSLSEVENINTEIKKKNKDREQDLVKERAKWRKEEKEFNAIQDELNEQTDKLKSAYLNKEKNAIIEYCEMVLNKSEYFNLFDKKFDIDFNIENGLLIIDYSLPDISKIPNINHVKYVKSRDEIDEKLLSKSALSKLFDTLIYQITLRTLHELFEADTVNAIKAICLNGLVEATNAATGHQQTSCILSLQTTKGEFEAINLKGIVEFNSYKDCFKSLKGVGSSKLSTLTPVRPIIEFDKSDKRFTNHYTVADDLDEKINLAAMDWEDFEHLVREIFQKEFVQNGGEVKVTQASSDGGVDAIAFDPDPIKGGKIVIQAKRYTNVVGVAAVRDLFGTVMNEGAMKGILVTTSDYGAESYNFAKDKPLTLLNGSHLLHLLEKHGHKAKIDIIEAKKLLKESA